MKKNLILLLIYALAAVSYTAAQTWTGAVNSDWNTPGNWTPAIVPGSSSTVTINNSSAPNQPVLAGNVNISQLSMSAGILNLNGFTLTATVQAIFTGDSLYNGKVTAGTFNNVTNMHMGGKIILDKTGASNDFWSGNNKMHGDSLIVIWRLGSLNLQTAALAPDSIFAHFKIQLADNNSVSFSGNSLLYVHNDLIIDNIGNGTFSWNSATNNIIGGNLVTLNFSNTTTNLILKNITTLGNNANGPFKCFSGSINNCSFNGNFTLIADSSAGYDIANSSFLGAYNLFQAASFNAHDSRFGQTGPGTTILRSSSAIAGNVNSRFGNNKFYGNAQLETFAAVPAGVTIQQNYYGEDSCWGNISYILKGNASLVTNENGISYVAGNVIIDGQGARKWVQFTGGSGNYYIGGNFTVKNFTPFQEPGVVGQSNVFLRNVYASGTDTCGTFYCYTGDITNCSFNGGFKLIADSSALYDIINSSFLGADNLFQAAGFNAHDSRFGQAGPGTTILRSSSTIGGNVNSRFGNNKYYGNTQVETFAAVPAGVTMQQNYYGKDSCLGNLSFILKGNASLITNENGINYVAGNVTIDGQGARKWVQFTGGTGNYYIGGSFTVKNFTPYPDPGYPITTPTNVHLRNVYANGTDTCGTFYCFTGDITNCSFNGDFKLIADSAANYEIVNSSFLGANNLFQAAGFNAHDSRFGQAGPGNTILRSASKISGNIFSRFGNNKFYGNAQLETGATVPAGVTMQQNYYGKDSCLGNLSFILKGNASLITNENGINYVAGNVTIDGQGARKWVQFNGGSGLYNVDGNFTAKNFTPYPDPGYPITTATNVILHNVYASGTDTCGTFYCSTGDIQNCSFNGNFRLISDSAQSYTINNSSFLGASNLFQSGNLDYQNNSFGQSGSGTTILRSAHNLGFVVLVRDGNNKFLGNVQIEANAQLPGGTTIQNSFYGKDSCFGNMTVNLNGSSNIFLANGGNLFLSKGLLLNNNSTTSGVIHNNGATAIHFTGTDTADYSYSGSGVPPAILNVVMNRRGGLRLQSPLLFTGGLNFSRGIILSSLTNPLNIPPGANIVGAWDSSYVDGPVYKTGNTAFTFPLGKNNVYAPISISPPVLPTDQFKAQYFNQPPHNSGYDSSLKDPSLHHISRKEYWILDRTAGTANLYVTLSWDSSRRSGIVNYMPDLRVARWNGSMWKDYGNSSTTGTNAAGTIRSLPVLSFSPFTLASSSVNNPLPVNFIAFIISIRGNNSVLLNWKTANEINNARFEVERSTDGRNWIKLSEVQPNVLHEYDYIDNTVTAGMYFYRIKQVDLDGNFKYSIERIIRINRDNKILIWPNPATNNLYVQIPFTRCSMEISDMNGHVVRKEIITYGVTSIPVQQLANGIYVISIKYNGDVFSEKFIKQ